MVHRWVPVALLAAALAAPLPFAGAGPQAATTTHVHIENFAFNPQVVSVLQGDTVTWDNHDGFFHTVTANDNSFNSGNLGNGQGFQHVFDTLGTYDYICTIHPSMTGTVFVTDPNALADLVISGITFVDVVPGVTKRVDVTVRNLGLATAPATETDVSYLHQGQRIAIGTAATPLLGPADTAVVSVQWNTSLKLGDFEVRAVADARGTLLEDNEANNEGVAIGSVLVGNVPGLDLRDPL